MSLYPEIPIEWNGETFHFKPTMAWVTRMECAGLPPIKIGAQYGRGDLNYNSVAQLLSNALRLSGAKDVDEDDILSWLMWSDEGKEVAGNFLSKFIPPQKEGNAGKNVESPEPKKATG